MNEKGFSIGTELQVRWRTTRPTRVLRRAAVRGGGVALATNLLEAASEGRLLVSNRLLPGVAGRRRRHPGRVGLLSLAFLDRRRGTGDDSSPDPVPPRLLMATVAYYLIVLAGLLLASVPGIIWGPGTACTATAWSTWGEPDRVAEGNRPASPRGPVGRPHPLRRPTMNNILGRSPADRLFATIPTAGWRWPAYRTLLAQSEALEAPLAKKDEESSTTAETRGNPFTCCGEHRRSRGTCQITGNPEMRRGSGMRCSRWSTGQRSREVKQGLSSRHRHGGRESIRSSLHRWEEGLCLCGSARAYG